ncbi:uncharacterized protein APUU_31063S [Aspergillus puulaauensis]|uniref:Uncharacterized protein n=1 Tax=Aspergillus puulaauensis TaxID=1220207 RepID=A0A7R7XJV7_9EURO|nr:uncharacterized protein APUU_31063S [Aspergillus puulaauensis]BCS22837.1 hypothetical protein APUU_31063S [Aspergillus puulaauensis]
MRPLILFTFVSLALSLAIPIDHSGLLDPSPFLQQSLLENAQANPESGQALGLEINHGAFIHADKPRVQPPDTSHTQTLHLKESLYALLDRYSDELYAAGLLLLVPIAIGIVELLEIVSQSMTVEEFPERGRDKHRLESLREREEWVLRRKEREMKVERSRSWWRCSRR